MHWAKRTVALCSELEVTSVYHISTHRHLALLVLRLVRSTMVRRVKT